MLPPYATAVFFPRLRRTVLVVNNVNHMHTSNLAFIVFLVC
jgi:hypothetical protein